MRLLAILCVLAMPVVALAQPIEFTGTDTLTVWWPAASGPVVAYETKLIYIDGTESTPRIVGLPPQTFTPRKGITFRLSVRGCREGPVCDGDWSVGSDEWKICPIRSDVDCSLGVGISDFGILVREWGEEVND